MFQMIMGPCTHQGDFGGVTGSWKANLTSPVLTPSSVSCTITALGGARLPILAD